MSLIKEIAAYSARPFFTTERDKFSPEYLVKLTLLTLGLAYLTVVIVGIIFSVLGLEIPDQSDALDEIPQTLLLFLLVVYAPLSEETVFRSWMGSHSGIRTALPIIAAIFAFLVYVGFSSAITMPALILFSGGLLFYFYYIRPRLSVETMEANFKYYFWISTILFALIHIGNYEVGSFNPALTLLILPQLIAGFIFGYTRMRFGILACMLTHGFYNGTIFLLINMGS